MIQNKNCIKLTDYDTKKPIYFNWDNVVMMHIEMNTESKATTIIQTNISNYDFGNNEQVCSTFGVLETPEEIIKILKDEYK